MKAVKVETHGSINFARKCFGSSRLQLNWRCGPKETLSSLSACNIKAVSNSRTSS